MIQFFFGGDIFEFKILITSGCTGILEYLEQIGPSSNRKLGINMI